VWTFVLSHGTYVLIKVSLDVDTIAPVAQAKRSSCLPSQPRVRFGSLRLSAYLF